MLEVPTQGLEEIDLQRSFQSRDFLKLCLCERMVAGTSLGLSVKQYRKGPAVLRACPLSPWHTAPQGFLFPEGKGMHQAQQMDHRETAAPTDVGSL